MRRWVIWFGIAILTLTVLSILVLTVESPSLYSPDHAPSSVYHGHLLSGTSPLSGSETLLSLMGEVLDGPARITISLHAEDLVTARQDLEDYLARSGRLDGLVIELNLSSSDIEDFRRYNQQNLQDMQEMVNLTARFSELERLEITYRDQTNPELLYGVSYEGEAIRQRAVELARDYAARESAVATASSSFELNTSRYEESVTSLTDITREIVVMQDERRSRMGEGSLPSSQNLSLTLRPTTVTYGGILFCSGEVTGGNRIGIPITIYLDSIRLSDVRTRENGQYQYVFPIQRIRAGTHLLYAAGDRTYSPILPFSVRTSSTTLTIAAYPGENDQMVISGVLLAGAIPVSGAPVSITIDALPLTVAETDPRGVYHATVNLSRRSHLIRSQFSSRDFPLLPSDAVLPYSPPDTSPESISLFLLPLGVLLGSVAIAIWYLKRWTPTRPPPTHLPALIDEPEEPPASLPVTPVPIPLRESPGDHARELFEEGRVQEAIVHLYRHLAAWIGPPRGLISFHTLTPREFTAAMGGRPFTPPLEKFTLHYEGLRYGGQLVGEEEFSYLATLVTEIEHASGGGED